jgi:hypothetical protein
VPLPGALLSSPGQLQALVLVRGLVPVRRLVLPRVPVQKGPEPGASEEQAQAREPVAVRALVRELPQARARAQGAQQVLVAPVEREAPEQEQAQARVPVMQGPRARAREARAREAPEQEQAQVSPTEALLPEPQPVRALLPEPEWGARAPAQARELAQQQPVRARALSLQPVRRQARTRPSSANPLPGTTPQRPPCPP